MEVKFQTDYQNTSKNYRNILLKKKTLNLEYHQTNMKLVEDKT